MSNPPPSLHPHTPPPNSERPPASPCASPLNSPMMEQQRPFFARGMSDSGAYSSYQHKRNSFMASVAPFAGEGAMGRRGSQASLTPLGDTARLIQAGDIGGSYGPYPRHDSISSSSPGPTPLFSRRASRMSTSDVAIELLSSRPTSPSAATPDRTHSVSTLDLPRTPYTGLSASSTSTNLPPFNEHGEEMYDTHHPPSGDPSALSLPLPRPHFLEEGIRRSQVGIISVGSSVDQHFLWEKGNADPDDFLHEADPELDAVLDRSRWRRVGWSAASDTVFLLVVILVCLGVFLGWPVIRFGIVGSWGSPGSGGGTGLGYGLGGINGSGQVPNIPGLQTLIDVETPPEVYSVTGHDGDTYNLVFSDEFNTDGRTFWPGDDAYWEAVDLHYWQTQDYEWYDPDAITTKDGNLEITLTQEPWNGLNFRSGMLQSWNKFCFSGGGRIEVNLSFPGNSHTMGYWPGVWTLGNLGRAGYGASNDGIWPYTYDTCDVGTLPNQTWVNGTGPAAARNSGSTDYGGELSWLRGQRASACTCEGEDHPGPNVNVGRGAPEIDVTEQQVDWTGVGSTSQSIQFAPMDAGYQWKNTSTEYLTIYNTTGTKQNLFTGAVYQESASLITLTDKTSYEGAGYSTFGFEYASGPDGSITWFVNNTRSWQILAAALGPDQGVNGTQVDQRLISVEPMSINLNLAISNAFQTPDWADLKFPGTLRVDYVRVYQKGTQNVGCDPPDYPTAAYIQRNLDVYTNANLTTYPRTFPKNSLSATGCA